jgi:hypothetical protein
MYRDGQEKQEKHRKSVKKRRWRGQNITRNRKGYESSKDGEREGRI